MALKGEEWLQDKNNYKQIQGFLTSKDTFVDRQMAASIALTSGQIKEKSDTLISENLY